MLRSALLSVTCKTTSRGGRESLRALGPGKIRCGDAELSRQRTAENCVEKTGGFQGRPRQI
jgi:hypothetical protein